MPFDWDERMEAVTPKTCGIVRHLETFSFGDYPKDCDMSATFSAIGATFSAITATKCDMAAVGDGLTAEGAESAECELVVGIGVW